MFHVIRGRKAAKNEEEKERVMGFPGQEVVSFDELPPLLSISSRSF